MVTEHRKRGQPPSGNRVGRPGPPEIWVPVGPLLRQSIHNDVIGAGPAAAAICVSLSARAPTAGTFVCSCVVWGGPTEMMHGRLTLETQTVRPCTP